MLDNNMKNIYFLSFLLYSFSTLGQRIDITQVKQEGKNLLLIYNIEGSTTKYDVSLFYSLNDGSTWFGPAKSIRGDAGKGIPSGSNKQITWNVLADLERLKGTNIRFKILAQENETYEPEMVFVQGGTFLMGSNDGESDEKPIHKVQVSDFYMGKTEITQAQWEAVMGTNPSHFKNCDNCPVEQVSYEDCQVFISKLNAKTGKKYRLPTEAEWEYAAKGGNKSQGYVYSGSNSIGLVAWYTENSGSHTHPVGEKQANELGIFDMTGNVVEWCQDWYDEDYHAGRSHIDINPKGALTGQYRVRRDCGWRHASSICRVARRNSTTPDYKDSVLGFRLSLPSR